MKQTVLTVVRLERLTANVYKLRLFGDVSDITAPGQFINIKINGLFLRRPISVYDRDGDTVTVIFKAVGKGTDVLAAMLVMQGMGADAFGLNCSSGPEMMTRLPPRHRAISSTSCRGSGTVTTHLCRVTLPSSSAGESEYLRSITLRKSLSPRANACR